MTAAVITGVGVVSALGIGWESFCDGLVAGRCGIGPIRWFDAPTFPTRVAGEAPIESVSPRSMIDRDDALAEWARDGTLRDRKVRLGLLAAGEAWRSAGCGDGERAAWLSIALGLEQAFLE